MRAGSANHIGASVARGRAQERGGYALVVVLGLVLVLSMVTASFSMRTSGAYRLTASRATSWQLYYAARAAIEESKVTLWKTYVNSKNGAGIMVAPEPATIDVGGVEVKVTFEDETGKMPLNSFTSADAAKRKELALGLARLFDYLALPSSTSLAAGIQDFIDADDEGMRESHAKNAPLFDVSELLAVEGFAPEILYSSVREGLPVAASLLSTWHTSAINVNSAEPVVLMAMAPRLTEADARAIIAARQEAPFVSVDDLTIRARISADKVAELGRWAGFSTDSLTLLVEARQGEFVRRMKAVVWLESTAAHTFYMREGWLP